MVPLVLTHSQMIFPSIKSNSAIQRNQGECQEECGFRGVKDLEHGKTKSSEKSACFHGLKSLGENQVMEGNLGKGLLGLGQSVMHAPCMHEQVCVCSVLFREGNPTLGGSLKPWRLKPSAPMARAPQTYASGRTCVGLAKHKYMSFLRVSHSPPKKGEEKQKVSFPLPFSRVFGHLSVFFFKGTPPRS